MNNNTRQQRVLKILLYAPSNDEGLEIMKCILDEIHLKYTVDQQQQEDDNDDDDDDDEYQNNRWLLLPMLSKNQNLRSTTLGDILQDALIRARRQLQQLQVIQRRRHDAGGGSVIFLGMDSPDSLPLQDIVAGLGILPPPQQQHISNTIMNPPSQSRPISSLNLSPVILCPADDGGYGMLCVPSQLDATRIFKDVLWSHPLTAISQLKAITDSISSSSDRTTTTTTITPPNTPIVVLIGQLMYDIDEPQDLKSLCQRLQQQLQLVLQQQQENVDCVDDDVGKGNKYLLLNQCSAFSCSSKSTGSMTTGTATATDDTSTNNGDDVVTTISSTHPTCYYTRQVLMELGLIK